MSRASLVKAFAVLASFAASYHSAAAFEKHPYSDAAFKAAQATGGPVVVHITAPWCPTCKAQHQALDQLDKNPAYAKVALLDVDFDSQKDVLKAFNATTQSTLIAFKGTAETGRSVGATQAAAIEELVKSATK